MSEPMQEPVSPPPPPPSYIPPASSASSGLNANLAAALAYITIIPAIVFLVLEPYNRMPLVRFHAFQSIYLSIAAFILQCGILMSMFLLHIIPGMGLLLTLIRSIVGLGVFAAWVICILKAYQGEWFKLPIIGDLAERQARG